MQVEMRKQLGVSEVPQSAGIVSDHIGLASNVVVCSYVAMPALMQRVETEEAGMPLPT